MGLSSRDRDKAQPGAPHGTPPWVVGQPLTDFGGSVPPGPGGDPMGHPPHTPPTPAAGGSPHAPPGFTDPRVAPDYGSADDTPPPQSFAPSHLGPDTELPVGATAPAHPVAAAPPGPVPRRDESGSAAIAQQALADLGRPGHPAAVPPSTMARAEDSSIPPAPTTSHDPWAPRPASPPRDSSGPISWPERESRDSIPAAPMPDPAISGVSMAVPGRAMKMVVAGFIAAVIAAIAVFAAFQL